MKNTGRVLVAMGMLAMSGEIMALEAIVGKIKYLEPTYLPGSIRFSMDGGSVPCPIGAPITYGKSDKDNILLFIRLCSQRC